MNDVPQAANQLAIMGIDAVYFPTDNIIASSYANIVTIFSSANVPVFPSDETWLKTGGLAAYSVDFYRLGVQTGHMAARVLRGESTPDSMPIEMQEPINLYSTKTKRIGYISKFQRHCDNSSIVVGATPSRRIYDKLNY